MENETTNKGLGRIVRLHIENVKRIRAVDISVESDGALVVIGGKNGAGKSSVLDSIEIALRGKAAQPPEPVRRGEDKAHIVCEFEDIIVTRTIKPNGNGTLKVTNKEGARFDSPQTMLDKLVGGLSFDPLAFSSRMKPAEQADTLRQLVGIDTTALDAERRTAYDDRTLANRDGKALKAQLDAMPKHDGVPEEERRTSAFVAEMQSAQATNDGNAKARDERDRLKESMNAKEIAVEEAKEALRLAMDAEHEAGKAWGSADNAARNLKDIDTAPITARMDSLDETNAKVRENAARAATRERYTAKQAEWSALDKKIKACDEKKRKAVEDATFPVEGLGFSDDGVMFNGFPFEQASLAEQLRVSVAMGIAMNPDLPVLLVHDGSLLDDESLAMMSKMAADAGAQVWIERVEDSDHIGIVIEDGAVVAQKVGA